MKKLLKNTYPDGIHFLIEFNGCDEKQIDNINFWKYVLKRGSKASNIPILNDHFYQFDPHGVTGFLLLASSHISVHTWPEYKYVACDVFSCSPQEATKKLVEFLIKKIAHKKVKVKEIKRGYKFFNLHKIINDKNELIIPIYSTGKEHNVKVKSIVGKIKSSYQDILFIDTYKFGRCLLIDGTVQTSEKDHKKYDKAILTPLCKKDKHILILGGGDGYVAEMALKLNPNLKINIIELDDEVIKGCKTYLEQKIFNDPRVHMHTEDAAHYLKNTIKKNIKFDGIVCDLTDEPIRKKDKKDFRRFYEEIIDMSYDALNERGWISLQAGAARVKSKNINAVSILKRYLKERFTSVFQKNVMIQSFGEENAFLYANKR